MNHNCLNVLVDLTALSSVFLRVTVVLMMIVMHCENAKDPHHIKEKYQKKLDQNIWELYVIGSRDTRALRSFYAFSMLLRINQTFCHAYTLFPEMRSQLLPPISLCFHFFIVRPQLFYYTTGNETFFDASLIAYVERIAPFLRFFSHSQTIQICNDLNQADLHIKVPEYQDIEGIASLASVVQSSHLSKEFTAKKPLESVLLSLRSSFIRYFIDLLLSLRLIELRGDEVFACTEPAEIESEWEESEKEEKRNMNDVVESNIEERYGESNSAESNIEEEEEEEVNEIGQRRRYRREPQQRTKQPDLEKRIIAEKDNDAQIEDLEILESDAASVSLSESEESSNWDDKSMESDLGVEWRTPEESNAGFKQKNIGEIDTSDTSDAYATDEIEDNSENLEDANIKESLSPTSYYSSVNSSAESEDSALHPAILHMKNRKTRTVHVAEYGLDPYKHYEHTDFIVIVDYQNVAMSYGKNKKFMCKGIKLCINYWESKGFKVVGFVPRYVLQQSSKSSDPAKIPDDKDYLLGLLEDEHIFQCPPQDYDDSYAIGYLKRKPSVIVSNDLFRDHMQMCSQQEKEFIKAHLISYTWAGDDFMPNPQFDWDNMIRASYK